MAVKAHTAHVQEHRSPGPAGMVRRLPGGAIGVDEVEPVAADVFKGRPGPKGGFDPAVGGADRDSDAIVLAYEHDGHRSALIGGPAGGVDRALGR